MVIRMEPASVTATNICSDPMCLGVEFCKSLCQKHYWRAHRAAKGSKTYSLWHRDISPQAAHGRCRALWGAADQYRCLECGSAAQDWAYDGMDSSALYRADSKGNWHVFSRFPEFYMPMCRSCHRTRDCAQRREELHEYRLDAAARRDLAEILTPRRQS